MKRPRGFRRAHHDVFISCRKRQAADIQIIMNACGKTVVAETLHVDLGRPDGIGDLVVGIGMAGQVQPARAHVSHIQQPRPGNSR